MPKEYRSRAQVVLDVLSRIQANGPIGITRLTADANLTHGRIQEHLAGFEANGLVERDPASNGWRITARGSQALEELRRVDRAMRDFGIGI